MSFTLVSFPAKVTQPSCMRQHLDPLTLSRYFPVQSDQNIEQNRPIFGNVAKTVAKISKIQLKIQNNYISLLLNININTTNHVWELLICVKM